MNLAAFYRTIRKIETIGKQQKRKDEIHNPLYICMCVYVRVNMHNSLTILKWFWHSVTNVMIIDKLLKTGICIRVVWISYMKHRYYCRNYLDLYPHCCVFDHSTSVDIFSGFPSSEMKHYDYNNNYSQSYPHFCCLAHYILANVQTMPFYCCLKR